MTYTTSGRILGCTSRRGFMGSTTTILGEPDRDLQGLAKRHFTHDECERLSGHGAPARP